MDEDDECAQKEKLHEIGGDWFELKRGWKLVLP